MMILPIHSDLRHGLVLCCLGCQCVFLFEKMDWALLTRGNMMVSQEVYCPCPKCKVPVALGDYLPNEEFDANTAIEFAALFMQFQGPVEKIKFTDVVTSGGSVPFSTVTVTPCHVCFGVHPLPTTPLPPHPLGIPVPMPTRIPGPGWPAPEGDPYRKPACSNCGGTWVEPSANIPPAAEKWVREVFEKAKKGE